MKIRHMLVSDHNYSFTEIDDMPPYELDVSIMLIASLNKG